MYFLQSGDAFHPAPSKDSLLEGLPLGYYTVEMSMDGGLFFKRAGALPPVGRLYGSLDRWADRILSTFQDRESNTGVLLAGEKGSGKSLLGRLVSHKAAELGVPTILVQKDYSGDKLGGLLSNLKKPAMIFLDEFEKVYGDSEVQESILSLLDGTSSSKHLFILTVNDTYRLDRNLKNRPGRLFYSIEFSGLEPEFIREYCEDKLDNKAEAESIVRLASLFENFNFDMVKALVEEMNRYQESAAEAVKLLNITPAENQSSYTVTLSDPSGVERELVDDRWYGSPLFLQSHTVELYEEDEDEDGKKEDNPLAEWERQLLNSDAGRDGDGFITFTGKHLVKFDGPTGVYTFEKEGWTITLKKDKQDLKMDHWAAAL